MRSSCSIEQMQEEAENALAAAEGFEVEPRAKSSWRSSRTQQSAAAAGKRLLLARRSSLGLRYGTLARMRARISADWSPTATSRLYRL